ncbi:xylulose kinase [Ornithinimicrobium sp. Arc0846-15]|nr:xylulose kinase [Ornithinimicrobium laminariae]
MSEPVLVAGVDSSTQSCKVVVVNAETGEVARQGRACHPDGTSVDPAAWWSAFEEATADGLLDGVSAISVGGQQHGLVALDAGHAVVRDALLWNDTRSASDAANLVAELGGPGVWAERVGTVPLAAITVAKVRWLAANEPAAAAATKTVVLPHDWLTGQILKNRGGFTGWTTDRGDASGTGYWSARMGEYDQGLMHQAMGRVFEAPRVLAPNEAAGTTDDGMVVGPGTGDNMGAALGLGLQAGDVVVSLGTSGTVFTVSDSCPLDASGAVAGFADATGSYLPLVCTLNAARVLSASADMLGVSLDELDELARSAEPGAGGLTLLPYLDGERTPDLPLATGTMAGMTRENMTPANIARAAVEGMLLNLLNGIAALRNQGAAVNRVFLIGGASASRAVQEVAARLFSVPVLVPKPAEYVALGAARQAAWALSGGDRPPVWPVSLAAELNGHGAGADNSEIVLRYADLLSRMHVSP